MNRTDWARLLASLCDDDGGRRDALLMLSDEDWVRDEEREWIRKAATRSEVLRPGPKYKIKNGWYWSCQTNVDEACCFISKAMVDRMGAVTHNDRPDKDGRFTRYRKSQADAWADLLRAISEESRS